MPVLSAFVGFFFRLFLFVFASCLIDNLLGQGERLTLGKLRCHFVGCEVLVYLPSD